MEGVNWVMNREKTAEKTRTWLSTEFQSKQHKANYASILKKAGQISDMPMSGPSVSVDDKLIVYMEAHKEVAMVLGAFDSLNSLHSKILRLNFVENLKDVDAMAKLDLEYATYYRYKQDALVEFAELYGPIMDLRVDGSHYLF